MSTVAKGGLRGHGIRECVGKRTTNERMVVSEREDKVQSRVSLRRLLHLLVRDVYLMVPRPGNNREKSACEKEIQFEFLLN